MLLLAVAAARSAQATTAQITATNSQQVIRGFGGATVFMPTTPLSTADLDTLFGNGPGQIGFSILRIRVAPDAAWRQIELSNALGATARGAQVMATPWSPPAAMKDNNSLVGGYLKPSSYADYAAYLNDFARYMAANGAPLYAISVQNEPDYDVTYESCDWTPSQMLDFCRNNAGAITATKVIMPESFQFRKAMSDPVLNDPVAAENIDIVGGHLYGGGLAPYPLAAAKGKELWMTEYLELAYDWPAALATGRQIHDCLVTANFNAYVWWYLRRYYGPLGEDGVVTKRGYVMAQFAKFIRPGFVRIDATANPATGVYVSAYKADKLVIVAINQGTSDATQAFSIQGANVQNATPWVTSATANLQAQPAITVTAGAFTATLPAQSVTTFVGDLVLAAPTMARQPQSHAVAVNSPLVLDAAATGDHLTYAWSHDGAAIAGATDRLLTLASVTATDAGAYTVRVSNSGGSVVSSAANLTVSNTDNPGRVINLSTRSPVGTNDSVQILGFVINGTASRNILVRAAGPALGASFGLSGYLTDPVIEFHDGTTGAIIANNDDWDATLAPTFASVGAFSWTAGSKDAALLAKLPPGSYTAIVRGMSNGVGVGLVEVYDADAATGSRLVNLSTRSPAGTGDNQQIAGFVVGGTTARTVVLRASGPSLHKLFGVTGALANPVIDLHSSNTTAVVHGVGWESSMAPHFQKVGAFAWPVDSKDSAIVTTLDPGAYTVVVGDAAGASGVALVEIYAE